MIKKNKYHVFTLGCQMNISDSEKISSKLENLGYESAPEKEADLIIVNACSVRQKAVDRIWGGIKKWQAEKKKIFITGCVLNSDRIKLEGKNIEFIDFNKKSYLSYFPSVISPADSFSTDTYNLSPITYVPIMTGCDNFCSYCAVPYTRGREVSRPTKEILFDVKNALKKGSKNILLLGQNVNSYGLSKFKRGRAKIDNTEFIKLLETIDNLPYEFIFNFMSSNPHDMSQELVKRFANLKKWPRELHLAMQSGDDEILKKMNRKYNSKHYLSLIENLKLKIANLSVTTDIIVGFPSETKTQFNNTVKIAKKIGFKKAYISQYSPRPGTASAKMTDNVPASEKKQRWLKLDKLINKPYLTKNYTKNYTPGV